MKIDVAIGHTTPADANIFLDLGFSEAEAAALKAELDREVAQHDAIKEELRRDVTDWIKTNRLKQDEAADRLCVSRPRVSDLVNGKLSKFSIDSLVAMAIRTGRNVEIKIS